jgi:hypothetical protein
VSALNSSQDSWYVEIVGVLDTNNTAKDTFAVLTKGAFHTEDVNRLNGSGGTRYWGLPAGQYTVRWGGRETNCGLACFNLVLAQEYTPTVTPDGGDGGGGDAPPSGDEPPPGGDEPPPGESGPSLMSNRGIPAPAWDGRVVVAVPNVSRNGENIEFRVHLEQAGNIQLALYSIAGERVYEKEARGMAGMNLVDWKLQNQAGSPVASGLYLYRIQVDGKVYSGKVAIIH